MKPAEMEQADCVAAAKTAMTAAERQRRHRARRKAELEALRQANAAAQSGRGLLKGWAAHERIGVVERELKDKARAIQTLRAERDAALAQLQALRTAVVCALAQVPPSTRRAIERVIAQLGGQLQAEPASEADA